MCQLSWNALFLWAGNRTISYIISRTIYTCTMLGSWKYQIYFLQVLNTISHSFALLTCEIHVHCILVNTQNKFNISVLNDGLWSGTLDIFWAWLSTATVLLHLEKHFLVWICKRKHLLYPIIIVALVRVIGQGKQAIFVLAPSCKHSACPGQSPDGPWAWLMISIPIY